MKPRTGIIPVTYWKRKWLFAFSLSGSDREIGDFGGHREPGEDDYESVAIREYEEEALHSFGKITPEKLKRCFRLEGEETVEFLYPVRCDPGMISQAFYSHVKDTPGHEVSHIVWIDYESLPMLWSSNWKVYWRISECLESHYALIGIFLHCMIDRPIEVIPLRSPSNSLKNPGSNTVQESFFCELSKQLTK